MKYLDINDLPKALQDQIKKDNNMPTRKVKVTKDEIRSYSISALNQVKGLSKSDIIRVLNHSLKMLEV